MNEEMLRDEIDRLQTEVRMLAKYKEYYEALRSPCLRIYYGRIGMSESAILSGISDIENFFRSPNTN